MERVVIVVHRRFNRANARIRADLMQSGGREREREDFENRISLSLSEFPHCANNNVYSWHLRILFADADVFTEPFARGTNFSCHTPDFLRISASEGSLKVQLWIRSMMGSSRDAQIPSTSEFSKRQFDERKKFFENFE